MFLSAAYFLDDLIRTLRNFAVKNLGCVICSQKLVLCSCLHDPHESLKAGQCPRGLADLREVHANASQPRVKGQVSR